MIELVTATLPERAAFLVVLDRDGVINEHVPDPGGLPEGPLAPEQVRLCPGAADAVRAINEAGGVVVVASNQPGVAMGQVDVRTLARVHAAVNRQLVAHGALVPRYLYCPDHPDAPPAYLRQRCYCRKPGPAMLRRATQVTARLGVRTRWMVGDSDTDIQAADAAGFRSALVLNPDSAHRRNGSVHPTTSVKSLAEAIDHILRAEDTAGMSRGTEATRGPGLIGSSSP
ncbi:HAD-IIIA family hydrolase [Micromonospora rifamycinica]|uniref:D-glycero-alpha-D-manno-heptose-1,7-bisphosphate 7-phosphatase n=1 Tax=Micromonospora rifamycinica TaxID=291594 RepID=UPI002E2BFB3F|nr:HAD-IIIA family hydrolase [Micromonospora rifamycinica]